MLALHCFFISSSFSVFFYFLFSECFEHVLYDHLLVRQDFGIDNIRSVAMWVLVFSLFD
jgi:hypothetical protein